MYVYITGLVNFTFGTMENRITNIDLDVETLLFSDPSASGFNNSINSQNKKRQSGNVRNEEKRYKCFLCSKSYNHNKSLNYHLKRDHNVLPVS